MKHILLLRHAKSSWDDSSLEDFDRPLAERGLKDAPRMGGFAKETGYVPDGIISSPAKRARHTTELFSARAGVGEAFISWEEDLYYGSARDYLETIRQSDDVWNTVMLVGHNPLMEETASMLCSQEDSYIARMPTAALLCFEHPAVKWQQVKPGTARLKWMVIPKLIKKLV